MSTASETKKKKPMDFASDPNLSLKEKWRQHMEQKRKVGLNTNAIFLNRWGPPVFFFIVVGCMGWGTVYAMPALYVGSEWEDWLFTLRALAVFMLFELSLNWTLTRYVGSQYVPAVHGTVPSDFPSEASAAHGGNTLMAVASEQQNGSPLSTGGSGGGGGVRIVNSAGVEKRVLNSNPDSSSSVSGGGGGGDEGKGKDTNGSQAVDLDYAPPNPCRKAHGGSYDGHSYRMMVATSLPTAEGHVERKSFPYWSWAPCLMCARLRPPRCHHCTLCQQCVLKRDHHCYMTGACIGLNNQRFFMVFLLWAVLLTTFGSAHMLPYTYGHVIPAYHLSYADFLPPVSFVRGVFGYVSPVIWVLALLFWGLLLFTVFSLAMLVTFCLLLARGKTGFEKDNSIKVTDVRSLGGKLSSVFGRHWWANIVLPTYPWITPVEDAVLWPHIKPC